MDIGDVEIQIIDIEIYRLTVDLIFYINHNKSLPVIHILNFNIIIN